MIDRRGRSDAFIPISFGRKTNGVGSHRTVSVSANCARQSRENASVLTVRFTGKRGTVRRRDHRNRNDQTAQLALPFNLAVPPTKAMGLPMFLSVKIFDEEEKYPNMQDQYEEFRANGGIPHMGCASFLMTAQETFLTHSDVVTVEGWMQPTQRPAVALIRAERGPDPMAPHLRVIGAAEKVSDPVVYLDSRRKWRDDV